MIFLRNMISLIILRVKILRQKYRKMKDLRNILYTLF